jgi:hypothetical protein
MTEQTTVAILGYCIAFLQAGIFFILKNLYSVIKELDSKITKHHENYDIHCSAEVKRRCLSVKT